MVNMESAARAIAKIQKDRIVYPVEIDNRGRSKGEFFSVHGRAYLVVANRVHTDVYRWDGIIKTRGKGVLYVELGELPDEDIPAIETYLRMREHPLPPLD